MNSPAFFDTNIRVYSYDFDTRGKIRARSFDRRRADTNLFIDSSE